MENRPEHPPARFSTADRNGHHSPFGSLPPIATPTNPAKTVGNALRHRWRLGLALVLMSLIVASGLVVLKPPTYQAGALLFVDERHNSSQGFDLALQAGELMSHHYVELATSREVVQAACEGPDASSIPAGTPCSPTELAGKIRADTVRGTTQISITASARSPGAAAALANAIANALVAQDQKQVAQLLEPTKQYLDSELQRLSEAIKAEKSNLSPGATSPTLAALETQYGETYARRQDAA